MTNERLSANDVWPKDDSDNALFNTQFSSPGFKIFCGFVLTLHWKPQKFYYRNNW